MNSDTHIASAAVYLMKELKASLPDTDASPEEILETMLGEIKNTLKHKKKLVLMPGGKFARAVGSMLEHEGAEIISFADNFKEPGMYEGGRAPVISPEMLNSQKFDAVLIATPSIVAQQDMMDQLSELLPERRDDFIMLFDIISGAFSEMISLSVSLLQTEIEKAGKGKRLCITTPYLHHNYLKLMKHLYSAGYHITLIIGYRYLNGSIDIKSFEGKGFFNICHIATPYDVIMPRLISQLEFDIVHAIVSSASSISLARALEKSPCCFISDYCDFKEILFDSDEAYLKEMTSQQLNREKKAWQTLYTRSDGVIIKDSPEIIDRLSAKYGMTPHWIQFMSYPSMIFAESSLKGSDRKERDGLPSLVYAGCVCNTPDSHAYAHHKSLITIARELNDSGIPFTIINAVDNGDGGFEEYRTLSEELPLFTYKEALPQDALAAELSRYDLGWFAFDMRNPDESRFFLSTTFGSKLFNYMEAGLPVVISREFNAMSSWVENSGIGKAISIHENTNLYNEISRVDLENLNVGVQEALTDLSMEKQIKRLMVFYDNCSGQKPIKDQ